MASADSITRAELDGLVEQYPKLISSISESKPAKAGQTSLADLDVYRYDEAPTLFAGAKPEREMDHDAVKKLVEWKLRHGKFRPTLMSLVSSNAADLVTSTVKEARDVYFSSKTSKESNVPKAMDTLTRLRGIGPATASLLLSVLDPERVSFFSDEAFLWLCCDGKAAQIKYTPKEYTALRQRAGEICARLNVTALEVEKAAYVVMKQGGETGSKEAKEPAKKVVTKKEPTKETSTKRKSSSAVEAKVENKDGKEAPVRRSKRTRT